MFRHELLRFIARFRTLEGRYVKTGLGDVVSLQYEININNGTQRHKETKGCAKGKTL